MNVKIRKSFKLLFVRVEGPLSLEVAFIVSAPVINSIIV